MSYREKGKNALNLFLKHQNNIDIIENNIYKVSKQKTTEEENIEIVYKNNIYQTVGDLLNGKKLSDILHSIKNKKIGWEHESFKEMKINIEEQDSFIENPFEVEEGVQQCKSFNKITGKTCNSKRVFYYSKQERGSDEPMTTYNTCCACGAKWKYSG